jgi:enoyl-CoA hydratase/carnithine racemase
MQIAQGRSQMSGTAQRTDYEEILYTEVDQVGIITVNRPEARNALTWTTYAEISDAVERSTMRCLILTGTDPAFCSGDDVKQIMVAAGSQTQDRLSRSPRLTATAGVLLKTDIPIVAAVNGAAVGWGMEMAMMADIRVASDRAKFGELFVKRGLCCDVAGLARLAQLVGRERAADLLFTGRVIDANEAERMGLVSRVVPHEQLLDAAMDVARSIAENPPLAVRALKRGLRLALDPNWDELGSWVAFTLSQLFTTEDHREGVSSFLERRPANFTGR